MYRLCIYAVSHAGEAHGLLAFTTLNWMYVLHFNTYYTPTTPSLFTASLV